MSLTSKAKTAVQDPEKIPAWVRTAIAPVKNRLLARVTHERTKQLAHQGDRLDEFRAGDSWMLIVLDACRFDHFNTEFYTAFATDDEIEPVRSEARDTFEWLSTVWRGEWSMPYVSGAVPVNEQTINFEDDFLFGLYDGYQPAEHLHDVRPVWREGWDTSLGACPPEPVVEAVRDVESDRIVAHIQQPHTPYIGEERELGHTGNCSAGPLQGEPPDKPIWERVKRGEISDCRLQALYRSNLRRARASVFELVSVGLDRYDRVAITADHGEALGEWGVYAHPRAPEHPHVRRVPWVEVTDVCAEWEYSPPVPAAETEMPVQDQLRALGYK